MSAVSYQGWSIHPVWGLPYFVMAAGVAWEMLFSLLLLGASFKLFVLPDPVASLAWWTGGILVQAFGAGLLALRIRKLRRSSPTMDLRISRITDEAFMRHALEKLEEIGKRIEQKCEGQD